MPQDTQDMLLEISKGIQDIRGELSKITQRIDYETKGLEDKIRVANHRIDDLEEHNKWLNRAVIGAIIVQVIVLFFK